MQEILDEYGYERHSGRIGFKPGARKKICDILGIKWNHLTATGKAALRGDMIEQFMGRHPGVHENGEYYLKKGRQFKSSANCYQLAE